MHRTTLAHTQLTTIFEKSKVQDVKLHDICSLFINTRAGCILNWTLQGIFKGTYFWVAQDKGKLTGNK